MTSRQEPEALGRIVHLVRDLRARCAWDAAQTIHTLRPYFVEEALELDRALADGHPEEIRAELGDVLLHLAFQVVLAEESGAFGAGDLARGVEQKMWRRHPHLYEADGTPVHGDGVQREHPGWERQKVREAPRRSVLDGLPPTMPALLMAYRLQEKAGGVGFDWPDPEGPRAKVSEELAELDTELDTTPPDPVRVRDEIGDLLFAVVNLARKLGHDPRAALEGANTRFTERFRQVEALAEAEGLELHGASLEVLDGLWDRVKAARQRGSEAAGS